MSGSLTQRTSERDLLLALNAPDARVRESAAASLGAQHVHSAAMALRALSYDAVPGVRSASAGALGALDDFAALPRLSQMQIGDPDPNVRAAAARAETALRAGIASALALDESEMLAVSIAPDSAEVYAASANRLYALRDGYWQAVGHMPDIPSAFAVADEQVMFAGSLSRGLYRSLNGGQSWQLVQAGMPSAGRLTVSALVVDPVDTRRVYVALAGGIGSPESNGAVAPTDAMVAPLGIYQSDDGGDHWAALDGAPTGTLTRRLLMDAANPDYLYGVTDDGAWRATLTH